MQPARKLLSILSLSIALGCISSQAGITLLGTPTFMVGADNSASGVLCLKNDSATATTVTLSWEDFTSSETGCQLGAGIRFNTDGRRTSVLELTNIPAGSNVLIQVEATNIWEAGESKARLCTNGVALGVLIADHWQVPFAVSLSGPSFQSNSLIFEPCQSSNPATPPRWCSATRMR
jgi:hypothetical protein